ncbi:MAG: nitrile hydratase accessory protein [Pseudomonadota bacterium]
MTAPQPRFEAPWHARVFALTVALNEAGHFAWVDWAEAFGATLKAHGQVAALDGGDDYFYAWLDTLEHLLTRSGMADAEAIRTMVARWRAAYRDTPHGMPVTIS